MKALDVDSHQARFIPRDWIRNLDNLYLFGIICAAVTWCGFLLIARTFWTRNFDYVFLVWNLALAAAPILFAIFAVAIRHPSMRLGAGACWLLFFPNSPYIVTDLMHLRTLASGPIWLDVLLVSSFAATGLAMGYLSLSLIHNEFVMARRPMLGWLLALFSICLCGFGIYLGRFLHWRSIDIIGKPFPLFLDIMERVFHPFAHFRAWGVSFGFASFIFLGYLLFRSRTPFRASPRGL
jgi:uncharacterized membrane protein